jgi:hypothetical protein
MGQAATGSSTPTNHSKKNEERKSLYPSEVKLTGEIFLKISSK